MRAPAATVGAVLLVFAGAGGLTGRAAQPVAAPVSATVTVAQTDRPRLVVFILSLIHISEPTRPY